MKHRFVLVSGALLLLSCGGGDSTAPPEQALLKALTTNMTRFAPLLTSLESSLLTMLNPGLNQNVNITPDSSGGAPPNSFLFSGLFDGNGDGMEETQIDGNVTYAEDPATGWSGMDGQAVVDVSIPVLGHVYHADVTMMMTLDERQLSGTGFFTDPLSGNTTTLTVAQATPLIAKPATGMAGAVANACGYSLDGIAQLQISGPNGVLDSEWTFSPDSESAAIGNITFTDLSGNMTAMPDSTAQLGCGETSGTINDWTASYDQHWRCLPFESGEATITISVTGPDTITITDEDPPGSGDTNVYQAQLISSSPHLVRGFFMAGPAGNQYREDFNWTLNGQNFSQFSKYIYTEGPGTGSGGVCIASATRMP
jgi:hypothetical protein